MMDRVIVDISDGSTRVVAMSAAEVTAREEESAAWILERNTRAQSDGIEEARVAARAAMVESLVEAELAKETSDIPEIEALRTALGDR